MRKTGQVGTGHTGATFAGLFSANADLSGLDLVGSEWEKCDLSKMNFRETDLSNSYFHGGRLQDCDFRGANLEGATFEKLKLLRCDFSGARGLDEIEFEDVDMDRVTGLDGQPAPAPPPPPAVGITSFTREQRTAMERQKDATARGEDGPVFDEHGQELPEFRPQDTPTQLLSREIRKLESIPLWVLDVPGLRPPSPTASSSGNTLETAAREAVRQRIEGRKAQSDPGLSAKAQQALRLANRDAAFAAVYLRETDQEALFRFSAAKFLRDALKAELDIDDPTASVDPRVTSAMWSLKLTFEAGEALNEVKRRLAGTQLFTSLLEAGFNPDNNWEEALDSSEAAQDLLATAGGDRKALGEAFSAFANLPLEARLRRLAYLGEAAFHLDQLTRITPMEGAEPEWLTGPEYREDHDREMQLVQVLKAADIPTRVAELAATELGIPAGTVPEDSDDDLFLHVKCTVCGKEKLIVQSKE